MKFELKKIFFPKKKNSLTGTPRSNQWPIDIPILREHFPLRSPKRPIDLCPELDEYANDLLRVNIKLQSF